MVNYRIGCFYEIQRNQQKRGTVVTEQNLRPFSVGKAGMRGEAGSALSLEKVIDFASAFGTMNSGGNILVAGDSRHSSPMLKKAVSAALAGCGCHVMDGGIMPAGMVHFLTGRPGLSGALLISGGHHVQGWNAVLPFQSDGAYFDELRCRELLDLYHGRRFIEAGAESIGRYLPLPEGAEESYWEFLASQVDAEAIRRAGLTVLADFGNGAGAPYSQRFAELFNLRLIGMNDGRGGVAVRLPDVSGICEEPLGKLISPLKADAGMVFNSDMSRMGLVSDTGESLTEELTFPLAAAWYMKKYGVRKPLVVNCCSSRTVDDTVADHGGRLIKCSVGQSSVIQTMRRENACMGGEGSGSFTFGAMPGFDAFLMAAFILESIACGDPLSVQAAGLKRYAIVKMTVPCRTSHGYALLHRLKGRLKGGHLSDTDGIRQDLPDGFLSLRLAGTEPMIRLIAEAEDMEKAKERAWQARLMLENQVVK